MSVRTAVLVSMALLVCTMTWPQENRLGDVAGSIKLNSEAIVVKGGTVEDPRAAKKFDEDLFNTVLADSAASADQLGQLVDEARATVIYSGDDLLTRLEESSRELERQIQGIYLLRLEDAYSDPVETARAAADVCASAGASVREEIGRGGVAFTHAKETVTRCRESLTEAQVQFATVANPAGAKPASPAAASTAVSEPATPSTDDEIVDARCEPERSNGLEAFEACQGGQYLALAALTSRNFENEMLVESVFSDIRQICAELHPKDFVGRNDCELDKMTATRLETE